MATKPKEARQALDLLADLGKKQELASDLTFEGTRIILPEKSTVQTVINRLVEYQEEQEQELALRRNYSVSPWDGAIAVEKAVRQITGTATQAAWNHPWFGSSQRLVEVNTGPRTKITVPWGVVKFGLLEGNLGMTTWEQEGRNLFALSVHTLQKYRAEAEGFLNLIDELLKQHSLYRGRAIDANEVPGFLDLESIDTSKTVYSATVQEHLNANIWSLLKHSQVMRDKNLRLKRSVLLWGPYGTGKTLAAYQTAQIAEANGWTFVYARPGKDSLENAIGLATIYQPSVVFFEDVDTIADPADADKDGASYLLSMFDGLTNKSDEVIMVLTTNHPEKIHKGLFRPGRLDAVIKIAELDAKGIETMIWNTVDKTQVLGELDMKSITDEMEGFMPAFVREALAHTVRYSIARNAGELKALTTEDFLNAARELRPQLQMMEDAAETNDEVTIDDLILATATQATTNVLKEAGFGV